MKNDDLAHKPLTFGSLFAGIGGFDLGLERAGMVCKWQVEIDPYASKVLAKHWPNIRRWDDVRTWPTQDAEYVDVICGGFPCQDISYAGKGAGLHGERSSLFFEAIRVIREMEPRFIILENVAALLTRGMGDVLGSLASIGIDAEWHCIPACSVGAPHIRDRVFILGYANGCRGQARKSARQAARHRLSIGSTSSDAASMANADSDRRSQMECKNRTATTEQRKFSSFVQQRPGRRYADWWSTEPNVGRVADGVPARVDRLRGLGNAVVPQVAEYIGRVIIDSINH